MLLNVLKKRQIPADLNLFEKKLDSDGETAV